MPDLGSIGTSGDSKTPLIITFGNLNATAHVSIMPRNLLGSSQGAFAGRNYFHKLGALGSWDGGVLGGQDNTQGNPLAPSLRLDAYGRWRFRWYLSTGTHTISINVLQAANQTPRPTLVVKANSGIGINSDVTGTAASGVSWVTIGPLSVTCTSNGATWVELWNNYDAQVYTCPCYFDHIVRT